jgi:hypothetical protein
VAILEITRGALALGLLLSLTAVADARPHHTPKPRPTGTATPSPVPAPSPTPNPGSCITITSPPNGATFHLADPSFPVSFTLDGSSPAASCGGQFSSAAFKVDTNPPVIEDLSGKILFSPATLGLGAHTFSITAYNASAQVLGTATISVSVMP